MIVHKKSSVPSPRLSFILLDWGCRERFVTLDWLNKQDVPREQYELIWVELYDRVVDEVMEKADVVITCNQRGTYHKHIGYNAGLLHARGDLICVCDSDAVFPADFVSSVFRSFGIASDTAIQPQPLVLMHYEWRTSLLYPDELADAEELKDQERWKWWPLIVNEGACVTVRKADAIRFGGFDEHSSYRGYLCGPYDLAWRLVNAGWPEVWHDSSVALWHFAHPDPIGTNGQRASLRQLMEKAHPHMQGHALSAVEAFSTGRFQPLQENPEIWAMRMKDRRIGSELEVGYSAVTGQAGFSQRHILKLWASLTGEILLQYIADRTWKPLRKNLPSIIGERAYSALRTLYHEFVKPRKANHEVLAAHPALLCACRGFNVVKVLDKFYAMPRSAGAVDLSTEEGRAHPQLIVSDDYYALLRMVRKESNSVFKKYLKRLTYRPVVHTKTAEHPMLLHACGSHNIVKVLDSFYAVPQGLGELDLSTEEGRAHPDILASDDYHELLKAVRRASGGGVRLHWKALFVGIAVSVALLYFVFKDIDYWPALWSSLANVNPLFVALSGFMIACGVFFRSWRWKIICGESSGAFGNFVKATNFGLLSNQLLPGRVGEAVKVIMLTKLLKCGFILSIGTAVIDRVIDGLIILFVALFLLLLLGDGTIPLQWVLGLGALLTFFVATLLVLRNRSVQGWVCSISSRWLHRWAIRPEELFKQMTRSIHGMSNSNSLFWLSLATVGVMGADYMAVLAALWSSGLEMPLHIPLLLWLMLAFGTALPSAPGYFGIYQLAAVWTLATQGVPAHQAVAVSFVLQAVTLGASLVLLGVGVFRRKFRRG